MSVSLQLYVICAYIYTPVILSDYRRHYRSLSKTDFDSTDGCTIFIVKTTLAVKGEKRNKAGKEFKR